jgi:hypothetical protein
MNDVILFERAKAGGKVVIAKLTDYKGSRFLDIREWVVDGGERKATRRGTTIPLEAVQALGEALIAPPQPRNR